jgi:hypothetical protein
MRQPSGEHQGEILGVEVVQVVRHYGAQRLAQPGLGEHRLDRFLSGLGRLERLFEQVGEVEHLDVVVAQRLGEGIVLLLGPADPWDAVEEEFVVVAWGQPFQLRAGPVQHDRTQPTDLAVGPAFIPHAA